MRIVEVGASHFAAAEFGQSKSGRLQWNLFAAESFVPVNSSDGEVGSELAAAVAKTVGIFSARNVPVDLVIPGHLVLTKLVKIPSVASAQRERIIRFEAQQSIPFDLSEVVWGHQVIDDRDSELEVLFAAVKNENVQPYIELLGRHGLDTRCVRAAGLAFTNGIMLREGGEGAPGMWVVVGARSSHLLFRQDSRFHFRTVSIAGNTVTRAIADRLEVTFSEAEQLKLSVLRDGLDLPEESPVAKAVDAAVTLFTEKITQEVSRSLVAHRRRHEGAEPTFVKLSGGGAIQTRLAPCLQEALKLSVTTDAELNGLSFASGVQAKVDLFGADRLGDLVGAVTSNPTTSSWINLLPTAVEATRKARAGRPRWLAAAALLILALAIPGLHYHRLANARTQAAATLGQRLVPVYALRARNAEYVERLNTVAAEAVILRQLGVAQGAWPGLLFDLQRQLAAVQDVWIERLLILPPPQVVRPVAASRRTGNESETESELEAAPLRLRISGRLLDRENPLSRVSQSSYERVTALLDGLVGSDYVSAVEGERFDSSEPGLLRFDFTLVTNPARLL